jgi:hypothetical protein
MGRGGRIMSSKFNLQGDYMTTDAYEDLEKVFPRIVKLMDDEFDSHKFILILAQKYQRLYIQALYEHREQSRPFHQVHMAIGKRLKKREDLVEHIRDHSSKNIFGEKSTVAFWRKVK